MMKILLKTMLFVCLLASETIYAQEVINSPDGNLQLRFELSDRGEPVYQLSYKNKQVICPSKLGLELHKSPDFMEGFKQLAAETVLVDTVWYPVWGQESRIRNNYRELMVLLSQPKVKNRQMRLHFRLFNDGMGFRYEFPKQDILSHFIVREERSEFALSGDHRMYWIPGDYDTNEYPYTFCRMSEMDSLQSVATIFIQDQWPVKSLSTQTPLMMKTDDGLYINIHEAALVNYPAMCLDVDSRTKVLRSHLVPDAAGNKGYLQTECTSPWRTVVVSDKATDILASRLILNLNEPCAYDDVSWIKPVKYIGVWWEYFLGLSKWSYTTSNNVRLNTDYSKLKPHGMHGATTENVKKYIDFAAEHGFDAVLVEGWNIGWERYSFIWKNDNFDYVTPYPDFDVKAVKEYAASKGVKVMMHHETASSVANYERRLDKAFQFMVDNGYNSVKTGYVGAIVPRGEHHDSQWMVGHYEYVVRKAAEYKIMVNSHEAVRPTGLCRTYPNWLAQESARGTEFESISEDGNHPSHTCILPFTRLMGGPMDYTPGILETDISSFGKKKNRKVHTTLVKQLALYMVMYSPLQMAADIPSNYMKYRDAFQFIKDVPVDWEQSIYLEAEPGEYITVARKAKGADKWFVGGITGENSRQAIVSFDFLPASQKYTATIYADGSDAHWDTNPKAYKIITRTVTSKSKIQQYLAPGGGFAMSLKPIIK